MTFEYRERLQRQDDAMERQRIRREAEERFLSEAEWSAHVERERVKAMERADELIDGMAETGELIEDMQKRLREHL